jgi:putative transposase
MRFEFIAKHRGAWPVSWICEALGVSRSGFHAWLVRAPSKRARSDEEFGARVRASFISSYRTYGARRVWHDLLAEGLSCGLHRIERLMRVHGLRARPRRRGLPKDDGLRSVIADNILNRQFTAGRPTRGGSPTSPTSGRPKGGSTSLSSSTCSRAAWSDGR